MGIYAQQGGKPGAGVAAKGQAMRRIMLGILGWTGLGALTACVMGSQMPDAVPDQSRADFGALCAPCHGASGRGNGPLAGGLDAQPADLTGLASRNGGDFPLAYVMEKIWGYANGEVPASIMPSFGPLLESPMVLFDAGDGISTPTPSRLVDLANYLATLQR